MIQDPTPSSEEVSATDMLDPVAWECRVAEARARRARALASRRGSQPAPAQHTEPERDAEADPAPGTKSRSPRRLTVVFLAGLGLGLVLTQAVPRFSNPAGPTSSASPSASLVPAKLDVPPGPADAPT
jgi:hypothetical protein